ncbi:MAG: anthranilate synthase component I [Candidatus Altiarchaeales archaeon ex4484_2]|nr:MAG: anthranilate synthase component I [Candidatus Altiarchaeales archaeon ex4484_2]
MDGFVVNPVYIEIQETDPVKAYNAVRQRESYLLESSDGGEKVARYSFIGFNPALKIEYGNKKIKLEIKDPELSNINVKEGDPIAATRNLMQQFQKITEKTPRFFGGLVGYFSYDINRYHIKLNGNSQDDLRHPDCEFLLAKNNIVFDHKLGKTYLISHQFHPGIDEEAIRKDLGEIRDAIADQAETRELDEDVEKLSYSSNTEKKRFSRSVREIKEHIKAGDIFQAVLSQRLDTEYCGDKFQVYRRLKEINPSPYMYYLELGDRRIVGSSPEMLARVEGRRVETYPIAGTRPRGGAPGEDERLGRELLGDEKERAEHVMLVDLGRNDIGRVSEYGSVEVSRFMQVEKYSHVQHIVSEVRGELRQDMDCFDALKAVFPAGTVSGAPKVRAMEIIDEIEPTRRGIYAGCVGYFSFNQNMDTAITIRTIDFEGDRAYIQVGAGIVADSNPEKEYEETINKGKAMLKAIEVKE